MKKPAARISPDRGRKYLPTLADLMDRISIVRLKKIFIHVHRDIYEREAAEITHDIQAILDGLPPMPAHICNACQSLQLINHEIWRNESQIRDGTSKDADDVKLQKLHFTHSINGVRNQLKNIIDAWAGGRQDYKIDCYAETLDPRFGNWNL